MRLLGGDPSAPQAEGAGRFWCGYAIFQTLLVTFGNAFFLWLCLSMHRKAYPQSVVDSLAVACPVLAVLAVLAPVLWLWYRKPGGSGGRTSSMTPQVFTWYTGRSLHVSEAFVVAGLILFFLGAPATASALVPAVALCFDALFLLPWAIKYQAAWGRRSPGAP